MAPNLPKKRKKNDEVFGITHANGWCCVGASQETKEVLLMFSSILGQDFYNKVATYFNRENKKLRELKRYITFIDELKYVYLLIITKKYMVLVLDTI